MHYASGIMVLLLAVACGPAPTVRPGLDVLLTDSLHLVEGRRIGLLANHAAVDAHGIDALTRLRNAGLNVTAIFSPEHGWRGRLDTENIGDSRDSATGLPVFSLYGEVREPTPAMLATVDVILADLPDIGARTFTYVSTVLRALRAAGEAGVPVVVLDRPNPIGGVLVQGPLLDTAFASFVGMLPVALRHGMTLAELVRLGADALRIPASLHVVPADGWTRGQWFDETGLPWVQPSPNMPGLESATHYPGLVLFEATSLSVGRGTPIAFQVVGAPWLDAPSLAVALDSLPGVSVRDTVITPIDATDAKHDGVTFPAVRLTVTDRLVYDPVAAAVTALAWLSHHAPEALAINARRFDQLAGGPGLRLALEAGLAPKAVVAGWQDALTRFAETRARYLLY